MTLHVSPFRPVDRENLFKKFHMKKHTATAAEYHLKIIFDSEIIFPGVHMSEAQVQYLVIFSLANLTQTADFEGIPNRMRILYAIRVLANLLAVNSGCFNVLIEKCTVWDTNLVQTLNRIFAFKNQQLGAEALWLVKNIVSCQSKSFPASDFIDHLHIPRESLPPEEAVA